MTQLISPPSRPQPSFVPGTKPQSSFVRGLRGFLRADFISVLCATIILVIIVGAAHPQFLSIGQLTDILQQSVYVALLAVGLSLLIAMREIDLSVGAILGLTLVSAALLMHSGMPPILAGLLGVVLGVVLGAVNALVVTTVRIQSLMATLATASLFAGIAVGVTNGQQIVGLQITNPFFTVLGGSWLGIPVSDIVLVVAVAVVTLLVRKTPFGYRLRNIGSSPEAAEFSGISIRAVRTQALIIAGGLAGIAGMCELAYFNSGDPTAGAGPIVLNAVAAAIIGGTPLRGGTCSPIGAAIGAILLTVVSSGLVYFNVPVDWSQAVTGLVILLALGLDSVLRNTRSRRRA
jgi:ribose transport system permease protein